MVCIVLVCLSELFAQTDSGKVFILPEIKIYQTEKNHIVVYEFENEKNKFIVNDSFLIADPVRYNYRARLNNINKVSIRTGTKGWTGLAWGAGFGYFLGFWFGGYFTMHGNSVFHLDHALLGGLIIAVPFGLIGGLAGLLFANYDDYELSKIKSENKKKSLENFLKEYNLKKNYKKK